MQLDALTIFSTAQAFTATAASTNTYDVTGAGSGNAPNMIGGQTSAGVAVIPAADIGAGDGIAIPEVFWNVSTAFTTSSAATLQILLQAAPDNGSNAPGTWVTLYESEVFAVAQLVAGYNGQFQIPPVPSDFGLKQPRFYRLDYVVGTGTFTAGALNAQIVINPSQAAKLGLYPSNFVA